MLVRMQLNTLIMLLFTDKTCYGCGETGHISKNCNNKKGKCLFGLIVSLQESGRKRNVHKDGWLKCTQDVCWNINLQSVSLELGSIHVNLLCQHYVPSSFQCWLRNWETQCNTWLVNGTFCIRIEKRTIFEINYSGILSA